MFPKSSFFAGFTILCMTVLIPQAPSLAQGNSKQAKEKKEKKEHPQEKGESEISVDFRIDFDSKEAHRWAKEYGLSGQKPLPPGIRKNLARGKPMPPGIAKTRMPGPFESHLPHHDGYEWRQAGTDLLLVAVGTLIIADILEHVFD